MLSRFLENPVNLGIPFLTTKYEFREGFVIYDKVRQKDVVISSDENLDENCIGFSSAAEIAGLKPATLSYRLARNTSTEYGDFVLYFPNFENLSLSFFSEMKKKSSL